MLRIDAIETYHLHIPLRKPFRTAAAHHTVRGTVIVKLVSGNHHGWGEASSGLYPHYSPECSATQYLLSVRHLAPLLLGKPFSSGQEIQQAFSAVKGNFFAKAAFDQAWWDLLARSQGRPLWQVIGGNGPNVSVGADFGIKPTLDELLQEVGQAVRDGFPRVKLKCARGWDVNVVEAVRKTFPKLALHIDCNSGFGIEDAGMFKEMDRFELKMIEQPLGHDDLIDHAKLQEMIQTPICLDESITTLARARQAIEIGACRWINIKPGRVGGLTNALAIEEHCREREVGCWVGGMFESAFGRMLCVALATLPGMKYPADISSTKKVYARDVGKPEVVYNEPGIIRALDAPGIGVEPDPETFPAMVVERDIREL